MAIYRFKVTFEDYDDVVRDIDIKSTQTFEDLHLAIHKSTGYNPEMASSFFVCNDYWIKSDEIAYLPSQRKIDRGVALMANTKLSRFIDDPHQKFYYTFNFERPYDFHVELVKILEEESGKQYPFLSRSIGEAPKMPGTIPVPPTTTEEDEGFDFLNETEYGYSEEETDDMDTVDSVEELNGGTSEDDEDEFADGFSDNDSSDSDEYDNNKNKDDY
ncbi:hypothetical protein ADIARSV_3859 [Arcticibacter svalbardensis MN12-7]|uniref:Plasmid pRiA4b Orf3-like domain-containing protein n=1 Tax=Arcticibacter svalbardensis MN12-7 TaxID=1150600 RepID=R9GMM6_9SPHI|nr:hypothetical protein [Arcticibacter svalbardensis]EOR92961.1 hypothetical protein ADIARSV_3859 [Arcticibacter svalbardensis MN12-7]